MARKPVPAQPKRLAKKRYKRLAKLDLRGWYRELSRIYGQSELLNLGLHTALSTTHVSGTPKQPSVGHLPVPTVRLLEKTNNIPVILRPNDLPALLVQVNRPDAIILAELHYALKFARQLYHAPIRSPGRQALNSKFGKRIFYKWRNEKIVPLADLIIWRAELPANNRRQYTDVIIGAWVGLHDKKKLDRAKKTLRQALASLDAIASQIANQMSQVKPTVSPQVFPVAQQAARFSSPKKK